MAVGYGSPAVVSRSALAEVGDEARRGAGTEGGNKVAGKWRREARGTVAEGEFGEA